MRGKELWKKLPKVDCIKENLELFWRFVHERQEIWYKRFVLKKSPPWTENPILRDYKFTNVYRELDYGTIWYMKNIVEPVCGIPPRQESGLYEFENLVWLTVMYRLVNRVETFEEVGLVNFRDWLKERREWKRKLLTRQKNGECIFTNAHLTLPSHDVGSSKLDKYFEVLDDLHKNWLRPVVALIGQAKYHRGLEDVFDALLNIKCVGRFIAYEVCCDLILAKAIPFTENDWVNPGPGCKKGINLIFPKVRTTKDYQTCIKVLCLHQDSHFSDYGLKFHQAGHPLTLRGIEHSLCEFQKYYKMIHKVGKQRMYFKPRDWPDSRGQQKVLRFPRAK